MKSKTEVEIELNKEIELSKQHYESGEWTDYNHSNGFIEACKWFLEPSEPKRMINDLTNDEIVELFRLATEINVAKFVSIEKNLYRSWILVFDTYAWGTTKFELIFWSDNKPDIVIYNYKTEHNEVLHNQFATTDRLREMLAKPKEG